jgi:hypothetical protein
LTEQTTPEAQPILARKIVADANLTIFVGQIIEAAKDGWALDEKIPPDQYGYIYEAHFLKDENLIDKTPTRADILANARSAKKLKAAAPAETVTETAPESTQA